MHTVFRVMNFVLQRVGLLILATVAAVFLTSCEEPLTGVENTDGVPPIDGDNTPYVEIQTGNEGDTLTDFRSIPDLVDPAILTVQSNVSVKEEITVDYEVSGPAEEGGDYSVLSQNPVTIPYDTSTSNLDSGSIIVVRGGGNLTTEFTTVDVTLTGVSAAGGAEVLLGRGGTDIGTTRTIGIDPSVLVVSETVSLDSVEVGSASDPGITGVQNLSVAPFTVQNFGLSGPNADEFSVFLLGDDDSLQPLEPSELDPAASQAVVVFLAPESEGEKEATLSFDVTNSVDSETYEVALLGTGVPSGSSASQKSSASDFSVPSDFDVNDLTVDPRQRSQ